MWTVRGQAPADEAWDWYCRVLLEELNDLYLVPNLLVAESRVSWAREPDHGIRGPIGIHDLEAEVK